MFDKPKLNKLFKLFLQGRCTEEEIEELISYLSEEGSNEELDLILEHLWLQSKPIPLSDKHSARLLAEIKNKTLNETSAEKKLGKKMLGNNWILKIAAALLVIAPLFWFVILQPKESTDTSEYVTKSTQPDQRACYQLPDGSRVSLNARSSITFPKNLHQGPRAVTLEGEAFFEVVKNDQPFVIESSGVKTRVLGTSFNIRAYQGEDIEVTVASGKVQVESPTSSVFEDSQIVLLESNEQATFSFENQNLTRRVVDFRKYLAWNSKELVMEEVSMNDVIMMLEKRFDQKIVLANSEIGNCMFRKLRYENESLETILKGLQTLLEFEYTFNGYNQWTIIGDGCKSKEGVHME